MEPILIYTDTQRLESVIKEKSIHLEDLNEILTDYKVLNLSNLTGAEFQELIRSPAATIFDKLTNGQPLTISSLPVNKQKAMELIVKPAGYYELLAIIESFTLSRPGWYNLLPNVDIVNDEVVLKQSVIDAETEASKVYVKTPQEKKLYDFAQAVIAAANSTFGEGSNYDLSQLVDRVIFTRATPAGTILMPVNQYSFQIRYRKFAGFDTPRG